MGVQFAPAPFFGAGDYCSQLDPSNDLVLGAVSLFDHYQQTCSHLDTSELDGEIWRMSPSPQLIRKYQAVFPMAHRWTYGSPNGGVRWPIRRCAAVMLILLFCNRVSSGGAIQDASANGDLEKVKMLLQADPNLISSTNYNYMDGFTPLLAAADHDHLDVVTFLLSKNSDVNAVDTDKSWTALHYAASNGNVAMVKLLLANKANINAKDRFGYTALHIAADNDRKNVIDVLVANHAEVDNIFDAAAVGDLDKMKILVNGNPALAFERGDFGITPLHVAAWHDQKEVAKFLLANKADVNAKTNEGKTPLHFAAQYGHPDMVELLLANKADIEAKTIYGNGETALQVAAMNGKKEVVRTLVSHKANYTIFDAVAIGDLERIKEFLKHDNGLGSSSGEYGSPLHIAAITGQKDAAALLLANNAAVDVGDNVAATPLLDAALDGHANVVELLLAYKANVNAKDKDGHTPLENAASGGYADIVKLLLHNNGDPNARDSSGFSPLFQAVRNNHREVVKLLVDAKADPNVKYFDGTTPLHAAAIADDIAIVELLLADNADVNARDRQGLTPLDYSNGHGSDVADLLRQHGGRE
jgi:ankyrin repeat protein